MDELYFRQIQIGPMANFAYLIGSTTTREAVLVDPAWDVQALLRVAAEDEMTVVGALVSHTHADHVGGHLMGHQIEGVVELLEHCKARLYVHKAEAEHLELPAGELVKTDEHTRLELGGVRIDFIHTPGHTPGSQCFKLSDRVVSGDTLFIGSCGRTDLPGSNPEDMYTSLTQKLMKLDDATLVFPGHNYAEHATQTDIATEKARNPFFRFPDKETFLRAMGY
ncbi:MAG TPA: MBL fold metallo-hydrolase [bacterium]|nr:MBL fold metallo-hydrolase [bacterium]